MSSGCVPDGEGGNVGPQEREGIGIQKIQTLESLPSCEPVDGAAFPSLFSVEVPHQGLCMSGTGNVLGFL